MAKKKGPRSRQRSKAQQEVEHPEDTSSPGDSPDTAADCTQVIGPDGSVYTFHPAAALFPLMKREEFDGLVADIMANGLQLPITRFQGPGADHRGSILEGRHRLVACFAAGVTPNIVDRDDIDDPVAFVISANKHRRHLTTKQKRELVAKLLQLNPAQSDRQVAEATGVSHPTVSAVRAEQESVGKIYQQREVKTKDGKVRARKVKAPKTPEQKIADRAVSRARIAEKQKQKQKQKEAEEGIGPDSAGEHARVRARLEGLENENQQLKFKITGLESEVNEAKAGVGRLADDIRAFIGALVARVAGMERERREGVFRALNRVLADPPMSPPDDGDGIPENLRRAS
jgi:hypothetical protein